MAGLGQIKPAELSKLLQKIGFTIIRQAGSHQRLKHLDGRAVTIAIHPKPIAPGTLRAILTQAGLTSDQFQKLWKKK